MTALLSRHAECAFWLARYLERAESMARILEAHVAFNRGRAIDAPWAWILALYADEAQFFAKFPEANAENEGVFSRVHKFIDMALQERLRSRC